MSFNVYLGLLPGTRLSELSIRSSQPASFDEVSSFEYAGFLTGAQIRDAVVLVEHSDELSKGLAAELDRQLYVVMLGGVASAYAIEAVGPVNRLRATSEGEITDDVGSPLAAEELLDAWEFDEDAHLAVFEGLVGVDLAEIFQAEFFVIREYE